MVNHLVCKQLDAIQAFRKIQTRAQREYVKIKSRGGVEFRRFSVATVVKLNLLADVEMARPMNATPLWRMRNGSIRETAPSHCSVV